MRGEHLLIMAINKTLVQQLSLEEKAALVSGKDFWFTAGVKHINLERMMMTDGPSGLRKQASASDALGLNKSVTAVCFPSSALTACSFDRTELNQLGHHLGVAAKSERVGVLLGPGINLKRSPLAGRNFEYFSEDPYLAGELASAYVNGVQDEGVGVSVKHFAANNRENQRFTMSSNMDERTLRELYLAPFEKVVKTSQLATVMCSYNAINGTLNSQNQRLLTTILREEWGFKGLVMSDWGAVADHVAALKAGLDLEMPGKGQASMDEIVAAVQAKQLTEADLDQAVLRVLQMVADWQPANEKVVKYDLEKQHEFARQLAAKSFVLLKNDQQALPIKSNDSLTIIGELAKRPRYQGGGSSHVNSYQVSIPLDVIQKKRTDASFEMGYRLDDETVDESLIQTAVTTAKSVDKVVIFAGFPESMESEGFDKTSLNLPDNQNKLI
ncbi:glycosyl hydrolase family 3 [Paucilactobacillus hokkaidonensis JCM 18461]|uniref:Glycosyl hydrolase family 3 n=2 Tax=Paucilactobacillus hokkaidonensis TaxID=1193095 RepID=A0A0A1GVX1_9LACO|nr:glycosyl hydrolase family 3 [Paucilactobacillus hokkaidonensis JCM 18461]